VTTPDDALDPALDAELDDAAEPILDMHALADRVYEIIEFEIIDEYRGQLGPRAVLWIADTLELVAATLRRLGPPTSPRPPASP
jgi:hypothetical protein